MQSEEKKPGAGADGGLGDSSRELAAQKKNYLLSASILLSSLILSGAWIYTAGLKAGRSGSVSPAQRQDAEAARVLAETVMPSAGVTFPVRWGNIGQEMIAAGVIDGAKFEALYTRRGGLAADVKSLLYSSDNGNLTITPRNSGAVLNLLWAFGLGNKNPILENGPMQNPQYGSADRFASTGGWTLAKGNAMNYYSKLVLATLTPNQQSLVERVAGNIYRPCCGNSTYFPDCNHGMAMLGLLELMASQGATADQMYKAALAANSYWFPGEYLTIARYLSGRGIAWSSVKPQDILAADFSSAQGYQQILARTQPAEGNSSNGCGT